ncbi:MAG: alanine/glycine:cation symporter family protein [Myxococcota bacterium]
MQASEILFDWVQSASDWLWGPPMLVLVLGTGLYLLWRLRAVQVTRFREGVRSLLEPPEGDGDISPFAALMTAVSGIVGNGNIAGVATAITAGGPGALFWMWVSGVVGMGTMFAESVLGVQYRRRDAKGQYIGGPMYYMAERLGWKWIAGFFAFGMAFKSLLATTTVQSNSIASVVEAETGMAPLLVCAIVAVLTGLAVVGGVRTVSRVAGVLAPFMGALYLLGAFTVLAIFWREVPGAIGLVVEHAFTPISAAGGFLGAGVREAFRFGVARGVYSNEAGTGSVPIAHASARTKDPVRQGSISMLGVFIDTLVVCTATGLVLLVTGAWTSDLDSTALTAASFSSGLGAAGGPIVLVASLLFGISTLIAWAFYGEQCAAYLFGPAARKPYRVLYCLAILGGAAATAQVIWAWGDLLNALVAIPNLVALVLLGREVWNLLGGGGEETAEVVRPAPSPASVQEDSG